MVGNGGLNPVKKWWWDIELYEDGAYRPAREPAHARDLDKKLDVKYEDQTLAVYPAPLAPHPWPYPFPMDREAGIEAYQAMITAEQYKLNLARGSSEGQHVYTVPDDAPVVQVEVSLAQSLTGDIVKYEMRRPDGGDDVAPRCTARFHFA